MNPSTSLRFVLTAALIASPSATQTWTVAPSGADFDQIQAAVDAAQPDDLILVAPGTYAPFEVGKPLRIVGSGSGEVVVENPAYAPLDPLLGDWHAVRIHGIAQWQQVLLSGMELRGNAPLWPLDAPENSAVRVEGCAGVVQLHDVHARSEDGLALTSALHVEDCAWLLVQSCTIDGNADEGLGAGLFARNAAVWISNSVLIGGGWGDGINGGPTPGEPGLSLEDAHASVWRSSSTGGNGGSGPIFTGTFVGFAGGDGILARGASTLELFGGAGSAVTAGEMGLCDACTGVAFTAGAGLSLRDDTEALVSSSVAITPGLSEPPVELLGQATFALGDEHYPTFEVVPASAQPGELFVLAFDGAPNSVGLLLNSLSAFLPLPIDGVQGAFALSPFDNYFVLTGYATDAEGDALLAAQAPSNPAHVGLELWFQTLELSGQLGFSNPALFMIRP